MSSNPPATRFADQDAQAHALAFQIAAALESAIKTRGGGSLVVSGGKTPVKLFQVLRKMELDWSRVCVALADERWVEPGDPGSNEHLVRSELLRTWRPRRAFWE